MSFKNKIQPRADSPKRRKKTINSGSIYAQAIFACLAGFSLFAALLTGSFYYDRLKSQNPHKSLKDLFRQAASDITRPSFGEDLENQEVNTLEFNSSSSAEDYSDNNSNNPNSASQANSANQANNNNPFISQTAGIITINPTDTIQAKEKDNAYTLYLQKDSVSDQHIASGAVEQDELARRTVHDYHLHTGAVDSRIIEDNAIKSDDLSHQLSITDLTLDKLTIGTGDPSHFTLDTGDAYISSNLEVEEEAYFDATLYVRDSSSISTMTSDTLSTDTANISNILSNSHLAIRGRLPKEDYFNVYDFVNLYFNPSGYAYFGADAHETAPTAPARAGEGDVYIKNDLEVNGTIYGTIVGDITTDSISLTSITATTANITTLDLGANTITDENFTGDWNFNNGNLTNIGTVNSAGITANNILPNTDSTFNLGAVGTEWANIYADSITAGGLSLSGNLNMNNNLIQNIGAAGTDFTATGGLNLADSLDITGNIILSGTVDGKDIAQNAAMLNEDETITGNWVNTANPWADDEVADNLTITGGSIDNTTVIDKDPTITLGTDLSGSVALSNLASGTLDATIVADSVALGTDTTGNYVATITGNIQIGVSGSGTETANISLSINTDAIGDSQLAYNTGQHLTASSSPTFGGLTLTGDLIPDADDSYSLGSAAARWKDLYLGGETLHLGASNTNEATVSYNSATSLLNFSTDANGNGDIAFFSDDLYLDKSGGKVGIGTTSPQTNLNLPDDDYIGLGTSADAKFVWETVDADANLLNLILPEGDATNVPLFVVGDTSIDNVDIGVFDGSTQPAVVVIEDDVTRYTALHSDGISAYNNLELVSGLDGAGDIYFDTGDGRKMVINNDGNVGIGTTEPDNKLSVDGGADFNGNVGIGTTGPNQALEVNGRIRMGTWTADGDTAVYYNSGTGDIGVTASDRRLKKNIKPIGNALDIVQGIKGVTFNWKDKAMVDDKTIGIIAQEAEAVMPELTFDITGPDGEKYLGVHYDKLSPILIEAVKEINGKVIGNQSSVISNQEEIGNLQLVIGDLDEDLTVEEKITVVGEDLNALDSRLEGAEDGLEELEDDIEELSLAYSEAYSDLEDLTALMTETLSGHEERITALEEQVTKYKTQDTNSDQIAIDNYQNLNILDSLLSVEELAEGGYLFEMDGDLKVKNLEVAGEMKAEKIESDNAEIRKGQFELIKLNRQEEISECNEKNEGEMYYNREDKNFYGCDSSEWVKLNNTKEILGEN